MGLNEKFFRSADEDEGFFNTVLYDGTGVTNPITTVGFTPDLVWIKNKSDVASHALVDIVRGVSSSGTGYIRSDTNSIEMVTPNMPSSFDELGFTLEGSQFFTNKLNDEYVAWCWKAGGAPVSNGNGDITSQVSANVADGFSIVEWSGDNTTADIGHGLNSAPEIVIRKPLNASASWAFDTSAVDGSWDYLFLNTTAGKANHSGLSLPTSTTFSTSGTPYNDGSMIAYCFHSVAGVSKVGSFVGTGVAGKKITLDFEPSWILTKITSSAGAGWSIIDNKRSTASDKKDYLQADTNNEEAAAGTGITFNTDGFTFNGASFNTSGATHIYYAIA